jgi:hypothetical protein
MPQQTPVSNLPREPEQASSAERFFRRVLVAMTVLVFLALAARLPWMFWSRHAITDVEAIVSVQSRELAEHGILYYDLNKYPYTVAPYGPLWYSSLAALYSLGAPLLPAGRLLSFVALLGILAVTWRILWLYTSSRYAAWTGTLLVASTANLSGWGSLSQSDTVALLCSVAAFYQYSLYRRQPRASILVRCGFLVALAIFYKQTFVSALIAIIVLLYLGDRRQAVRFTVVLGFLGTAIALGLNWWTEGRYFQDAITSNINPFTWENVRQHVTYFLMAAGGLIILGAAGLRRVLKDGVQPFYVYLVPSILVWMATAPKVGSDLNYQMETMVVLAWCAAWSLHRLEFFPLLFRADRGWVTLLQIPLLLHMAVNLAGTGNSLLERIGFENLRRVETAHMRPFLEATTDPVISVQIDPLLQTGRRIDVEPMIYNMLVGVGTVDPEPVRRDLAARKFAVVVHYQNLFADDGLPADLEVPTLPDSQLAEIRRHYRLVQHVPGPLLNGTFVYLRNGEDHPSSAPIP